MPSLCGKNIVAGKANNKPARFGNVWWQALILTLALMFFGAQDACALQTHGGVEGMVVHQFAHLHYILALGFLLWDLYRPDFVSRPWLLLRCFCVLMILWNILALVGHFAQSGLPEGDIVTEDGYLSAFLLLPLSFGRWVYYVAALDHLLCVPALFCLFLAMRRFYRDSLNSQGLGGRSEKKP
ncbi:MAG: hypothetical protein LBH14_09490 [Desulfobulbaceae bacterium]|nr:hypothetical protein [Desulfobulbaceae bacterium]